MKLETNGVMTLKNINLLNNDFLGKITTLEQEVNVLQQTLGTATQDIDESGTVWMYDQSWNNSGDIVPDQITPASDATPLVDSGTGVAGTSNEFSRGDHKHPLQVSDVLPSKDTSVGTVEQASSYARSDHQHPIQTVDTIPNSDSAYGSYGTVDSYSRNDHSHPINVQTNASIVPIVSGVRNNGTSAYYSRHDHIHPQQLTYDGNVTATKFIKSGGTDRDLEKYQQIYTIMKGVNKTADLWCRLQKYCREGQITQTIERFNHPECITDILTSEPVDQMPTDFSDSQELLPNLQANYFTINNAPFTQDGSMQINPTVTSQDDGLRISRSATEAGNSSIQLGCSRTYNTELTEGQWVIFTPSNTAEINPYGLVLAVASQTGDNTRGLQISANGNTLSFNGNVFVDLTTDQSIAGIKTFHKLVQVIPSANGTFNERIRISRHPSNQWSNIQFGSDPNTNFGKIDNQWLVGSTGNNGANPLGFVIVKAGEEGQANRGLQISADGNTLSFNGQVIACGSVNYPQGSTILWGTKSLGTDGGFYTDGTTVFWRDNALQFDKFYQG
ncbi:MAG: hypothetical protein EZS28_006275 [Streblomastix strix]|uniref:Uncharacterized protein n=1 Tax=Streblomastix strix TaxID=222440 RepID=A0A5J4WUF6_9EUKA|nr:MAG: hypothetical protein EZS28_006275 [Streblomastix strix]